jgi:hypothetical protein
MKRTILFDGDIEVKAGAEWHSKPIHLKPGDRIVASATGTGRFYAGLYDRVTYHRKVGAASGGFAFEFGTDRRGFTDTIEASEEEDFYLVYRVGIFGATTTIHSRVELQRAE